MPLAIIAAAGSRCKGILCPPQAKNERDRAGAIPTMPGAPEANARPRSPRGREMKTRRPVPCLRRGDGADPRAGMRGTPWTPAQSPAGHDAGEDRGRRRPPCPRVSPRIFGRVISHSPCRFRPPAHQSRRDGRTSPAASAAGSPTTPSPVPKGRHRHPVASATTGTEGAAVPRTMLIHQLAVPASRCRRLKPTAELCRPCKAALATMRLRRPLRGLVSCGRVIPGFPLVTLGYVCAAPGRGLRRWRPYAGGAAAMAPTRGRGCGDGADPRAGMRGAPWPPTQSPAGQEACLGPQFKWKSSRPSCERLPALIGLLFSSVRARTPMPLAASIPARIGRRGRP